MAARPQVVPLIILGIGQVGGAFLGQLAQTRDALRSRYGVELRPVALADSRALALDREGLSVETLEGARAIKRRRGALSELAETEPTVPALEIVQRVAAQGVEPAIVIDTTAADGMEPALHDALERGYGVVLANKRPLAGPRETARAFFESPRVRFEATVGAGLPVVNTLRYLVDTGDRVRRIEGALSGTLGYLCSRLEDGEPFSLAVSSAKARGYTEPDPRDDLSGMDVARKTVI
jgi:homoserine dehydrogenase